MKKTGILLKAGFVALAAIALSSASYSQGAEMKSGSKNTNPAKASTNTLRGSNVSAVQSKQLIMNQKETSAIVTTSTTKTCTPKALANPYSISRKNFNNLPADRQKFVLNNSNKYTIVD